MTAAPVQEAVSRLAVAVDQLWSAVGELTLIVLEDQPEVEGLAVTDQLVKGAQDVFASGWASSKGNNGYVSFELDPLIEDIKNRYTKIFGV